MATVAGMVAWEQRNHAIRERVATDRTARFLVSLFKIADPNENRGNSITVREMLDRGAAQVGQGLEAEPAIRADLRTAMGEAYAGLGLYEDAKKLLNEAEREQKGNNAPYDSQVRTLLALGSTLYLSAAYADAEKMLARAVEIARAHLPAGSELRSEALDDLADVYAQQEKYGEAEQLANEALNADRRRGPEQASVLAHTLDTLGSIYFYGGNLAAAEKAMREALELHKSKSEVHDAATAQAMANLAAVYYLGGRYGENLALLQQALPIYRAVYGADHPEVASLLIDMGRSALMMGRVDEAEPLLRNALSLAEKLKGATHDELVSPLNSLAMIDAYHGKLSAAASEIERAEKIARLPAHGMILDQVLLNVADVQFQLGNFDRSTTSLSESRRLLETAFPLDKRPTEAWRYAVWDTVHAELLAHEGKDLAARKAIEDASPVIAKRFGSAGFYSLLVERRSSSVENELKRKSQGK
jgi:tetratricopeptide (TPR) repeat protein